MTNPIEQFSKVLMSGRFMHLAVRDSVGPWSSTVAYNIGPGPYLYFYSAKLARHSQAIEADPTIGVSIDYIADDDVDGIQASARAAVVRDDELPGVINSYFNSLFPDEKERSEWIRPASDFNGSGIWSFYKVELSSAYVYDHELFESKKIDGRQELTPEAVVVALHEEATRRMSA